MSPEYVQSQLLAAAVAEQEARRDRRQWATPFLHRPAPTAHKALVEPVALAALADLPLLVSAGRAEIAMAAAEVEEDPHPESEALQACQVRAVALGASTTISANPSGYKRVMPMTLWALDGAAHPTQTAHQAASSFAMSHRATTDNGHVPNANSRQRAPHVNRAENGGPHGRKVCASSRKAQSKAHEEAFA